jgi:hypothetical protein
VIRSRRGRLLAIPTENAPRKGTDGRRISLRTFPAARFVPRQSGPSLLVVDGLRGSRLSGSSQASASDNTSGLGETGGA